MKIRVLWFGRRGQASFDDQVETYRRRVGRRWPAEDRVLRPAAGGRDSDPVRALREEARAVAAAREAGWPLVVLDERGERCSSEELAARLLDWERRSTPGLDLVVGSDLGLDRGLVAGAAWALSLGGMTLPHAIARLVLWEQLFRATHILGDGRYHRSNVQ
ncbi:MAG: 23S rRNA (pseudouridine(1915)-N(3))-methyltransferase RlmH [Thermoanaerobaculales bacterium]|nr:23S rRNA (pseudouridine(1915)-N(3))-methyltransferase RlmH [Thermoanaerobaculales bacterium]